MRKFLNTGLTVFLIIAFFAVGGALTAAAEEVYTSGKYTYAISGGEASIRKVDTSIGGRVVIPATLGGYPVTTITQYSFNNCDKITAVDIPNCVKHIEYGAFFQCDKLTEMTFGTGLESIAPQAVMRCSQLTTVKYNAINAKLSNENSSDGVFDNCNALKTVILANSVKSVTSNLFRNCDALATVKLPKSITTIGNSAFRHCDSLNTVTIPNTVTTIGEYAFNACDGITEVVIGAGVKHIGKDAFSWCEGLTTVVYNAVDATTDGCIFRYCTTLKSVLWGDEVKNIPDYLFAYCDKLESVSTPNKVKKIGVGAFYNCSGLARIVIGSNVETIKSRAFSGCRNLKTITIPNKVTSVEEYAFFNCDKATKIVIGTNVEFVGTFAFAECKKLSTIVYNAKNAKVEKDPFYGCVTLKNVTFGDSVKRIPSNLFSGFGVKLYTAFTKHPVNVTTTDGNTVTYTVAASGAPWKYQWQVKTSSTADWKNTTFSGAKTKKLKVPTTMARNGYQFRCRMTDWSGDSSYSNAASLKVNPKYYYRVSSKKATITGTKSPLTGTITLPSKLGGYPVTAIGSRAFMNMTKLKSVTIPSSIKAVGDYAFYNCTALASVKIGGNVTKIGCGAFYNNKSLKSLTIPSKVTIIGDYAFGKCVKIAKISLPSSIKTIGTNAFVDCTALPKAKIAKNPVSVKAAHGTTHTFTVAASGTRLKYQWQVKTSSKAAWKNTTFSGAKTKTLKVPATTTRNGYQFRCRVTNLSGANTYTKIATLTVRKPKIITQPKSISASVGDTKTFTAKASGVGLKYQWQVKTSSKAAWKNATFSGSKTATMKVPVTKVRNGYRFRCRVTDAGGNRVYSKVSKLTISKTR